MLIFLNCSKAVRDEATHTNITHSSKFLNGSRTILRFIPTRESFIRSNLYLCSMDDNIEWSFNNVVGIDL